MAKALFSRCNIEWMNQDGRPGYALNPHRGCASGCLYCWSREIQRIPYEEWIRPRLREAFQGIDLAAEVIRRTPRDANVLLSASTDPFQPIHLGFDGIIGNLLRGLSQATGIQVWVLTKSGSSILVHLDWLKGTRVGVTVVSRDNIEQEPHADPPWLRLFALEKAKKAGCSTFISIEPWLKDITDPRAIIEASQEFCDLWILGSHNRRMRPLYPEYYRQELPPLLEWIHKKGLRERVFVKKELTRL